MTYDLDSEVVMPSPGSPPGMTSSKTSKSSSFCSSLHSDDNSVLDDASHFEDIGLDDDAVHHDQHYLRESQFKTSPPNPYSATFSSDLRAATVKHASRPHATIRTRSQRDITGPPKARPPFPSLQNHVRNVNVRSTSLHALSAEPFAKPAPIRGLASRSATSLPFSCRRSLSPRLTLTPRDPNALVKPRRSSWQSNRERKSAVQLERECDEDDGDDIPDGLILDNVPISPRPPSERSRSQPASKSPSPDRASKARQPSVGNGTPPVAQAQGSLRSPTWKSGSLAVEGLRIRCASGPPSPIQARARSWNAALADLSAEAKALTEKLEEHADEVEETQRRPSQVARPNTWNSPRRSLDRIYDRKYRAKSSITELPPLRRTDIMVDPLPISKEKEAVLSRTRPSWLPPKDPAEERRHLREYQKMMAHSVESDRRREEARRAKTVGRDSTADSLMRLWEEDIVPRWNDAIREPRTRELWWMGVAPRSRGVVWPRAIGNELGLTETSYQAALARAREVEARVAEGKGDAEDTRRAAWFKTIRKDVEEATWGDLRIFQAGGPLHDSLVDILSAYSMYRSDIGYVSGCNTIAALLLLNLPTPTAAFVALANVLNRALPLSFYAADPGAKSSAYNLVLQMLSGKSVSLHEHLVRDLADADPDAYLNDVFTSVFTSSLAIDEAARLWDVYVFEGDGVLVRAAVALLMDREMALLGSKSVAEVRAALQGGTTSERQGRVVGETGAEDRWMQSVRNAGKS